MGSFLNRLVLGFLIGALGLQAPLGAQDLVPPRVPSSDIKTPSADAPKPIYTAAELEQLAAPIALYPDTLLSQVLMASTYPLEIVLAARWVADPQNAALKGDALKKALEDKDWEPSVKSIVPFPQVLGTMNEHLAWTETLGKAFLAQEKEMMDAIQHLRRKAKTAGNLKSNAKQTVKTETRYIVIEAAAPRVVYVPYYDPWIVYGGWYSSAYPPYYWGPPSGFYFGGGGWWWGPRVYVSGFLWGWGQCHWHHHHVHIDVPRYNRIAHESRVVQSPVWRHNPAQPPTLLTAPRQYRIPEQNRHSIAPLPPPLAIPAPIQDPEKTVLPDPIPAPAEPAPPPSVPDQPGETEQTLPDQVPVPSEPVEPAPPPSVPDQTEAPEQTAPDLIPAPSETVEPAPTPSVPDQPVAPEPTLPDVVPAPAEPAPLPFVPDQPVAPEPNLPDLIPAPAEPAPTPSVPDQPVAPEPTVPDVIPAPAEPAPMPSVPDQPVAPEPTVPDVIPAPVEPAPPPSVPDQPAVPEPESGAPEST